MPLLVKLRGMPWCEVTTPGFPRSISITSLASSKRPSSVEGQLEQVVAHTHGLVSVREPVRQPERNGDRAGAVRDLLRPVVSLRRGHSAGAR
jgi:hypothetical protein